MNYKNRKIIEIAQAFGYTTVKEFANFLKIYNPSININENGEKSVSLNLI